MSAVATAIVGGAIVGGYIASEGAKSAAESQSSAARYAGNLTAQAQAEATAEAKRSFDLGRADLAPWRRKGEEELERVTSMIEAGPGEFEKSPGYDFRLSEGTKALERGAAARGGQLGGAQQKALVKYGQDFATNDYDNFLNRYYQKMNPSMAVAGMGQGATNVGVQAGQNYAQNVGQIAQQGAAQQGSAAMAGGNARATGYINQANAYTGSINSGLNNYFAWQGMQGTQGSPWSNQYDQNAGQGAAWANTNW